LDEETKMNAVYRGFRWMTSLRRFKKPEGLIGLKLHPTVVEAWVTV